MHMMSCRVFMISGARCPARRGLSVIGKISSQHTDTHMPAHSNLCTHRLKCGREQLQPRALSSRVARQTARPSAHALQAVATARARRRCRRSRTGGKLRARDERGAQLKVLDKGEELRPLQQHERQRGHRRRDRLRRRVQVHVEDLLREGGSPDRHTTCGTHGAAVLGTHRAKHKAHFARDSRLTGEIAWHSWLDRTVRWDKRVPLGGPASREVVSYPLTTYSGWRGLGVYSIIPCHFF